MKFFITWDCGFGASHDVIDAPNMAEAEKAAYEVWREEAENNATYDAEPLTQEIIEDWGLDETL